MFLVHDLLLILVATHHTYKLSCSGRPNLVVSSVLFDRLRGVWISSRHINKQFCFKNAVFCILLNQPNKFDHYNTNMPTSRRAYSQRRNYQSKKKLRSRRRTKAKVSKTLHGGVNPLTLPHKVVTKAASLALKGTSLALKGSRLVYNQAKGVYDRKELAKKELKNKMQQEAARQRQLARQQESERLTELLEVALLASRNDAWFVWLLKSLLDVAQTARKRDDSIALLLKDNNTERAYVFDLVHNKHLGDLNQFTEKIYQVSPKARAQLMMDITTEKIHGLSPEARTQLMMNIISWFANQGFVKVETNNSFVLIKATTSGTSNHSNLQTALKHFESHIFNMLKQVNAVSPHQQKFAKKAFVQSVAFSLASAMDVITKTGSLGRFEQNFNVIYNKINLLLPKKSQKEQEQEWHWTTEGQADTKKGRLDGSEFLLKLRQRQQVPN